MATPLTVSAGRRGDDVVVLTVTGEIDLSNIEAFAGALDSAAPSRDGGSVTVDLSGVEYLDSGAISVLFGNADHIRVIANPVLMPVLRISGLTDVASVELAG
jgi:anti-anti-sigma factor